MTDHIMTEARAEALAAARIKRWEGKSHAERLEAMIPAWSAASLAFAKRIESIKAAKEKAKEAHESE